MEAPSSASAMEGSGASAAHNATTNSKRRRGLGVVTANACTECRKKRSKCDGKTPCGRCSSQVVECVYETPVRQSKEHMRTEIDVLRAQQQRSEAVLAALTSASDASTILDQLRGGETLESIAGKLDAASPQSSTSVSASGSNNTTFARSGGHQAVGSALRQVGSVVNSPSTTAFIDNLSSFQGESDNWPKNAWGSGSSAQEDSIVGGQEDEMKWELSPAPDLKLGGTWRQSGPGPILDPSVRHARGHGQETILGSTFGMEERPEQSNPAPNYNQSWTAVTNNSAFVEHLMALYFCWEYPTFASLSKEHFLDDFRTGTPRHCSPMLVNAMLAVGCRFSKQDNARTDANDRNTTGDHFFAEATRLLEAEVDRYQLTTVQALGLMAIREASCGRSSHSLFLSGESIRLAVEMGLHHEVQRGTGEEAEIEHAVRSATFWGAFSLDQAWSLSIGRLPHFSQRAKLVTKPAIVDHVEASQWVPYTDDGSPLATSCTQPSNVRSVYKTFCELSEVIHTSLYTLYNPGCAVTSQSLNAVYNKYISWYQAIPETLRLGHNFTPAVLFAHMYYHYAILLLFRPFIKLEILGSGLSPRSICSQAADAICMLTKSYSDLYTLERTPSFVPYFSLTASIAHLVTFGNSEAGPERLYQGIADLKQMAACHEFAFRAHDILRFLKDHWHIVGSMQNNDEGEDRSKWAEGEGGVEAEARNLCIPNSMSLNLWCPNVTSVESVNGIGKVSGLDNPMFWPFPMQGKPLVRVGKGLEDTGFKVLD